MPRANYPDRDRLERVIQAGVDRGRIDLKLTNGNTVSFRARSKHGDTVTGTATNGQQVKVDLSSMHVTIT